MWDSDVDFDLAAFHALVRALKRTLRQLVEASLAHVLLQDAMGCHGWMPRGWWMEMEEMYGKCIGNASRF